MNDIWTFQFLLTCCFVNRFLTKFTKRHVSGQFNSQWTDFVYAFPCKGSLSEQQSKQSLINIKFLHIYTKNSWHIAKPHFLNWELDVPRARRPPFQSFLLEKNKFLIKSKRRYIYNFLDNLLWGFLTM